MQNVEYSIIIPHKNIPVLLQRCLDSIPFRNDVQVIVVDDNSDEAIVDFDHFPGIEREDIDIIFTKEGRGAGFARNVGLSKAVGKWVLFADADDFFNYCYDDILNEYRNSQCDLVFFNASSIDTETYVNSNRSSHINMAHRWPDSDSNKEFFFRYLYGEPWGKIIRKSVLDRHCIKCEETIIHNDTQLSYLIGYYARDIKYDPRALYCVTDRVSSVSKQYNDACFFTRLSVFCKKYSFLSEHEVIAFEDEFILSPFLHYRAINDWVKLEKCYEIAEKYGITKSFLDKRIKNFDKERKKFFRRQRLKRLIHMFC